VTTQTAVVRDSVITAAAAAQERWAETTVAKLACLEPADRVFLTTQLRSAGARAGTDWAEQFAARVFVFALWSGFVFASVTGAVLWATMIPSRHAPAAATAGAYLMILVVALPVCWSQARQTVNHLRRISGRAPREFLTMYVLVLAVAAVLFGIVNRSAFNTAPSLHPTPAYYAGEFAAFCAVTALGFLLSYLVMAYAYANALQESGTNSSLSWAGTLAATAVTGWLRAVHRSPAPAGNRYLDSGLLRLLGCVATIDMLGQEQDLAGSQTVKSVILALEAAAADIEQYAVDRVPRLDAATRRRARQDGVQLASVIRDAKASLARAVHPRNYLTVAGNLTGFLLAWARPDKSDFTTLINGGTAIARVSLWRRAASRVWNAALLAAAGVVLPLLPIYKTDHAAAAGLRYALFTAAVLALATGGTQASGTIERNLERTLPGPPDSAH
jgi:hypothetical protein